MFPNLVRVTSYGAAKFILGTKTIDELKELREAGLLRIHMGLESGDDAILKIMNKGSTSKEMIDASLMVNKAGLELSQYVLLGLGGKNRWQEHAKNTARVLNAMDPDFIRLRTLILREDAPMYEDYRNGTFIVSSPLDILNETQMILENLDCESHFLSDHVSNYANINGRLPDDKDKMLKEIHGVINRVNNNPNLLGGLMDPARCTRL
jgi:radical SAM superfamily enzyme